MVQSILKVDPEIYEAVIKAWHEYCGVEGCCNLADDMMHKLPKYERHIKRYPLYIHSPFNLIPGCRSHHASHPNYQKPTDDVGDLFERFLQDILYNPAKYRKMVEKTGGKRDESILF